MPGVLRKSISNLTCSYSKKYEIHSNKIFSVVKIFYCFHLKVSIKYFRTLFNYNLTSNCCEFLMAFIKNVFRGCIENKWVNNRTRVLVGIVIFKAC